ncbi:MAG: NAD(P)-dependent oxidoreductase [Candidatus Limnocylindria bacterium]
MARVAITGAAGQLGRRLVDAYGAAGHEVRPLSHADLDITEPMHRARLRDWAPEIIVNAAAWTDVDGCARDPSRAMRVNGDAPGAIGAIAAACDALAVQISTNEVFDGTLDRPYREDDAPRPLNAYGVSKLAGERAIASSAPRHLIVRTAWLFGPGGTNFITKILAAADRAVAAGDPLRLVEDEWGNPTWTPDLAVAIVELSQKPEPPAIVHAVGDPPISRLGWATVALDAAGIRVTVAPVSLTDFERASTPPARAILRPSDGLPAMDWRPVTERYAAESRAVGSA